MADEDVTVIVRTADRTRKAEVTVARQMTGADIIQGAVSNWALPTDVDYTLVNVTRGMALVPTGQLGPNLVGEHDELEVQPVLVAGAATS